MGVPREMRIWVYIRAGLGKGMALHLDPGKDRYEIP